MKTVASIYNNELPPDRAETERANRCAAGAQKLSKDFKFKEFEVTNIRHVKHENDANEIKYILRALVGDGQFMMVSFTWKKGTDSVTVNGCKKTDLSTALEWF